MEKKKKEEVQISELNDNITEEEYDRAIKEIKEKSAPRKDNTGYKMIKEPLNCFKVEMIKIFNNI